MVTKAPAKDDLAALKVTAMKKYNMSVGSLGDIAQPAHRISTGNVAIDHIIGGGIPLGRSTELFGPPSSGKTTTALQTCASLQKIIMAGGDPSKGIRPDDRILYMDYEQALDPKYVLALGFDMNHETAWFSQADSLEDGTNFSIEAIETGRFRLVVFDSVASMQPNAKSEAEIGKSLPAVQAKLMSDFTQKMNPILNRHNCAAIYLNHVGEVMEMGRRPGMPAKTTTPGGKALKFYSSVRVEYKQIGNIKETAKDTLTNAEIEQVVATNVKVNVVKNKTFPPFRQAVVRVRFGVGFDNFWTSLQILIAQKLIAYSAGYFYFDKSPTLIEDWMPRGTTKNQRPYIRGEKNIFPLSEQYPEWAARVIAMANEVVNSDASILDAITPTVAGQETDEDDDDEVEGLDGLLDGSKPFQA